MLALLFDLKNAMLAVATFWSAEVGVVSLSRFFDHAFNPLPPIVAGEVQAERSTPLKLLSM